MSSAFPISFAKKTSEIEPASYDTPLEPALELLRQGNKLASQEQFSDADKVFCTAASLPGGKAIWNFKSLGFCPTVFPDASSIDASIAKTPVKSSPAFLSRLQRRTLNAEIFAN